VAPATSRGASGKPANPWPPAGVGQKRTLATQVAVRYTRSALSAAVCLAHEAPVVKVRRDLRKRFLVPFAILLCTDCFGAIVIPIELEKGNPIASARINGVPVRLVIDSGGGVIALKPETAKAVGAARPGPTRSSTDALGNENTQAVLALNTLEIGGSNFSSLEATEYAGEVPAEGSIGRAFLNRFLAIYDYSSHKITLFTSAEHAAAAVECRGARVRTIPDPDGTIVSMAKTDDRGMRMLWDTGATYSFVKKTFADSYKLPIKSPFYTSQRFLIGNEDFGPLQLVVLDLRAPGNVDGYIGYNFFASHVVCIDPVGHVVRIRKS
jgi:predicted aspartyl protease